MTGRLAIVLGLVSAAVLALAAWLYSKEATEW